MKRRTEESRVTLGISPIVRAEQALLSVCKAADAKEAEQGLAQIERNEVAELHYLRCRVTLVITRAPRDWASFGATPSKQLGVKP